VKSPEIEIPTWQATSAIDGRRNGDRLFFQPRQPSLDVFWRRYESLEQPDNFSDPDVLAQEILEDLETAFETIPRNRRRKRSIDAFNSIFV
jgi:hypothetical protein